MLEETSPPTWIIKDYKCGVWRLIPASLHFLNTSYQLVDNNWFIEFRTVQSHRMVDVGRDLWRSSGPTPLLKQGQLEPVAQDHAQTAFGYLQGGRLDNLSLFTVSQPRCAKGFLMLRENFLCF